MICDKFNDKTKLGFANPIQPHFIRFSSRGEDKRLDITGGQLKLAGYVFTTIPSVLRAFNPFGHIVLL